jgi:hypothetical protein
VIPSADDFWDIPSRERKIRENHRQQVDALQRAIGLADRISAVKSSPGWTEFVKTLEDCHQARVGEMVAHVGSSEQLWVLQGRLRELKGILALVRNPERNRDTLAKSLQELQDAYSRDVEPRLRQEIKT